MRKIEGKRAAVVGLGRSGRAAAKLLASKGAEVVAVDLKPAEELSEAASELHPLEVEIVPGGHHPEVLKEADLVVLSPGVKASLGLWRELQDKGVEVVGELELASWWVQEPIVAITGTNGKTTTASLTGHLLREAGRKVFIGGNIGSPLSDYVLRGGGAEVIVLEVSSFQLATIRQFHPWIAVLLNLSPDHLDWHGDFDDYRRTKARVFENQTPEDWAVLNVDDPESRGLADGLPCRVLSLSKAPSHRREGVFSTEEEAVVRLHGVERRLSLRHLPLVGRHNLDNAMAAVAVAALCGVDMETVQGALGTFKPLPHRLELVGEVKGVSFFDDSKATNPLATLRAVQALGRGIVLIAGGQNKGLDLSPLRKVSGHLKAVVAIGEAAEEVIRVFDGLVPAVKARGMEEAVSMAQELACKGDKVLLSPACASFDMFQDYRDRGEAFRRAVEGLLRG